MTLTSRPPIHSFRPFSPQQVLEARERRELSWIEPPPKVRKSKTSPSSPKIPSGLSGLPLEIQQQILAQLKGKK